MLRLLPRIAFIYSIARMLLEPDIMFLHSGRYSRSAVCLAAGYESPSARALLRIALYSGDSDIIVWLIFARQSALSVSAPKQIEAVFISLSVRTAPLAKFSALDNA